jgi:ubiquinone/menaquinone biosynthesis C-methylase UbiE
LAAAGANVTVLDNSDKQLTQDRYVAERDALSLHTVKADMSDLSGFNRESFDFIIHPVSNLYVPELKTIWKEAYRVLNFGGKLLSSFMNPSFYLFDQNLIEKKGILKVKYALPYSDYKDLSLEEKNRYINEKVPFEFSHTLEGQIGGQLDAGFVITGFYEDRFNKNDLDRLSKYMATFIVTCAEKKTNE